MRTHQPLGSGKNSYKFMQVLDKKIHKLVQDQARLRGVTFQELLRTDIVPEWLHRRGLITIAELTPPPLAKTWKQTAYGKGMLKAIRKQRHR